MLHATLTHFLLVFIWLAQKHLIKLKQFTNAMLEKSQSFLEFLQQKLFTALLVSCQVKMRMESKFSPSQSLSGQVHASPFISSSELSMSSEC